jgi:hypothetical protein
VVHRLGGGRQRLGALLHLEVHPDLEEAQGRELSHRLGSGQALQHLERPVEAQRRAGLRGDREPDVEVVVAEVVVGDTGVRVDDLGRPPRVRRVDLRGHQHRAVAEHPRVEDRGDLANDSLVDQSLGSAQNLLLRHAGQLGDMGVGPGRDREAALEQVQQSPVQVVQRDRGPIPSAPNLAYRLSHRATSFAW